MIIDYHVHISTQTFITIKEKTGYTYSTSLTKDSYDFFRGRKEWIIVLTTNDGVNN